MYNIKDTYHYETLHRHTNTCSVSDTDIMNIKHTFIAILVHIAGFTALSTAAEYGAELDRVSALIETGKPDSAVVVLYDFMNEIGSADERVRAYFYYSQAMAQLGRSGESIDYLTRAYEESSESDFARAVDYEYCRMLFKTGNFDRCIETAETFLELHSDSPFTSEIRYTQGNALVALGEFQRAFNIFNAITSQSEDTSQEIPLHVSGRLDVAIEAIMKEGLCLYKLDFIGGAIERFEQYLAKKPNGENAAETLFYLGNCYEITQQPELAIRVFRRLTIEYPSFPEIIDIYYKLGLHYYNTGFYTQSRNAFANFVANTDPIYEHYNDALLNLERIAYRTGEYFSEIDIYENFVRKYPENPLTPAMLFELAQFYKTANRPMTAIEKYNMLITEPQFTAYADSAVLLSADTYTENGMFDQAVAFLMNRSSEAANSLKSQMYLLKIGSIYENRELFDTAISWYDSSYTIQTSDDMSVRSLMGIGRIFNKMDRWLESGLTYERILNEYPDTLYLKDVYLSLSEVYRHEGRLKDAALTMEKAVPYAEDTEKIDILMNVAGIYEEIEQEHALQLYSIIFSNNGNSTSQKTDALNKFGELAMRIGENVSAAKVYAELIKSDTDSILVSLAREKLSGMSDAVIDSTVDFTTGYNSR